MATSSWTERPWTRISSECRRRKIRIRRARDTSLMRIRLLLHPPAAIQARKMAVKRRSSEEGEDIQMIQRCS